MHNIIGSSTAAAECDSHLFAIDTRYCNHNHSRSCTNGSSNGKQCVNCNLSAPWPEPVLSTIWFTQSTSIHEKVVLASNICDIIQFCIQSICIEYI